MTSKRFERDRTPLAIVAYALYLYLSGLSLRKDSRAISLFLLRSHQSIWRWLHRFGSLSEALYVGKAKVAVVDERTVIINGEEARIWDGWP
jgi:transposase-like protein